MGRGNYSAEAHRRIVTGRARKKREEVFTQRSIDPRMAPRNTVRESRDSEGNEDSIGIVFALDVSSSMEEIPQFMATQTLPDFMDAVLDVLPDAQVLFMAFGNAYADRAPLQVGQFESTGPLMDQWLKSCWIESGGGGMGESYDLAMLYARHCTTMDCWEKRKRKGYCFITGDEVNFTSVTTATLRKQLGLESPELAIHDTCAQLLERYEAFFLIPDPVRAAQCEAHWRMVLGERVVVLPRPAAAAQAAALLVRIVEGAITTPSALAAFVGKYAPDHPELTEALSPILAAVTGPGFPAPRGVGTSDFPGFAG
jgi:hypothetical protein